MEWDQRIFYHGYRAFHKAKKIFQKHPPYFELDLSLYDNRIQKYLLILMPFDVKIYYSKESLFLFNNSITLPKKIYLMLDKKNSEQYIRLLLLIFVTWVSNKESRQFIPLWRVLYLLRKKFPGINQEYQDLRINLKTIRLIDKMHYLTLLNILYSPQEFQNSVDKKEFSSNAIFENPQNKRKEIIKDTNNQFDVENSELLEVDKNKIEEYTLGHNFEKIETVEEFDGNWRDIDGSDDLDESEALNELNLKHLIRTEDAVHLTQSTEASSGSSLEISDITYEEFSYTYDEWDYKKKQYKKDFCSLKESKAIEHNSELINKLFINNKKSIELFKKKMMILLNEKRIQKRKTFGTEIDLDAIVERYADIVAKVTPNENVYTNPIQDSSNIVFYFLIDVSLSSDSWIEGRRILDIARESLLIFSESLEYLKIPFGIAAYYSRTRNHCRYIILKSIEEKWSSVRSRLGGIQPIGYTRIGPALRHANFVLEKTNFDKKWIILITDGRPNDYDRYEGKYGIEDVHQAVKECSIKGVSIHSLAIGLQEKPSIPAMMRDASYQMLMNPNRLIDSMYSFFKRAIR